MMLTNTKMESSRAVSNDLMRTLSHSMDWIRWKTAIDQCPERADLGDLVQSVYLLAQFERASWRSLKSIKSIVDIGGRASLALRLLDYSGHLAATRPGKDTYHSLLAIGSGFDEVLKEGPPSREYDLMIDLDCGAFDARTITTNICWMFFDGDLRDYEKEVSDAGLITMMSKSVLDPQWNFIVGIGERG